MVSKEGLAFKAPWVEKVNLISVVKTFKIQLFCSQIILFLWKVSRGKRKLMKCTEITTAQAPQHPQDLGYRRPRPPNMLIQDPSQLVFKSKRTKFVIEKFHLPPDLSENVSRDNKDKTLKQTNIDFWCFFFRCKQWPWYKYHSKSDQHTCYSRTSPPRWRRRPGRASWWWQPCPYPLPLVLMTRMKSSSPQTDQQYLMPQLHFLESKLETLN